MATIQDAPAHDDSATDPRVPSGTFRADLARSSWQWSDEIYALHGLQPGQIVPTTAALLAHVHPADRAGVERTLHEADDHGVVSTLHRVVAADGSERVVCLVGQAFAAGPEGAPQIVGHLVDLTHPVKRTAAALADASIRAAARSRDDIERAKTVVGLVLGVDDDGAFDVLRRRSNTTNVPVRLVARALLGEARRRTLDAGLSAAWLEAYLASDPVAHDA
ncbi:PAS and ANTAR domain-containing protein [Isoptericola jiangsuensis]|uniref:PAS and ANTAR domain-containing protein n=1 Tax=Isoptericola jiangsuensis TaxID=548579 RepID=UPI003AAE00ED